MLACLATPSQNCAQWHLRRGNIMKSFIGSTFLKSIFLGLLALVMFGATQKAARADEVTIAGSTTGTDTAVPHVTFSGNASFIGTTALGSGSVSCSTAVGS